MDKALKIGVIGSGNMGSALLKGIISAKIATPTNIMVSDSSADRLEVIKAEYGVMTSVSNSDVAEFADVVILAIKPQQFPVVAKGISFKGSKLFISILAGVTLTQLEALLPAGSRVVRAMPNTPSLVNLGVTAICVGSSAKQVDIEVAEKVLKAVGSVFIVEEKMMNAISAISGSGPAYFFMIIDALGDAGVRAGLSKEMAVQLAAQTALGSAKLLLESGKTPTTLKDMVTSPAGTTIEAIKVLEEYRLRAAFMNAIDVAIKRADELGK